MKGIKIKVIEKCDVDGSERNENEGLRIVYYNSPKDTLLQALEDYENNFDSDNIYETYDEFDGECQDSEVIEISIISEFPLP